MTRKLPSDSCVQFYLLYLEGIICPCKQSLNSVIQIPIVRRLRTWKWIFCVTWLLGARKHWGYRGPCWGGNRRMFGHPPYPCFKYINALRSFYINDFIPYKLDIWYQAPKPLEMPLWDVFLWEQDAVTQTAESTTLHTHWLGVHICCQFSQVYLHSILQHFQFCDVTVGMTGLTYPWLLTWLISSFQILFDIDSRSRTSWACSSLPNRPRCVSTISSVMRYATDIHILDMDGWEPASNKPMQWFIWFTVYLRIFSPLPKEDAVFLTSYAALSVSAALLLNL